MHPCKLVTQGTQSSALPGGPDVGCPFPPPPRVPGPRAGLRRDEEPPPASDPHMLFEEPVRPLLRFFQSHLKPSCAPPGCTRVLGVPSSNFHRGPVSTEGLFCVPALRQGLCQLRKQEAGCSGRSLSPSVLVQLCCKHQSRGKPVVWKQSKGDELVQRGGQWKESQVWSPEQGLSWSCHQGLTGSVSTLVPPLLKEGKGIGDLLDASPAEEGLPREPCCLERDLGGA